MLRVTEKQYRKLLRSHLPAKRTRKTAAPPALLPLTWRADAWVLTLPLVVVSEANQREYWRVKARRTAAQRKQVRQTWQAAYGKRRPAVPCVVTLTRVGGQALDEGDNLNGAFKGVRDEIAEILGVNDRDPRLRWRYAQEPGPAAGIRIEIEEAA